MKSLFFIVGIFITWSVSAQNYSICPAICTRYHYFKRCHAKKGLIKWFPSPNEKLRFKENEEQAEPEAKFGVT